MADPLSGAQIALVPSFTGEANEDVENWIMAFEGLQQAFGWEEGKAAKIAEAKFKDKAARWLRGQRSFCLLYTSPSPRDRG